MSCSGATDRPVLFAADIFDGARIGEDVFTWEAFERTARRLCHLYSMHNTILYCDTGSGTCSFTHCHNG